MRWLPILLFATTGASAQSMTTGAIAGRTLDKTTGEPLAGVTIVVGQQSAISDEDGNYKITDLLPGDYAITFYYDKTKVIRHEHVGANATVTAIQAIGQIGDVIEVHGHGPQIDVNDPTIKIVQDSTYLTSLPIPGRTATDAAGAAAGATNDGVGIAVSGSTGLENRFLVDGVDITGLTFGNVGTPVLNEFVEETEVITGGYNAEYGRATGGIVNIITKTGTNTLKGSVFATYQPGFLAAKAEAAPVNASSIDITSNRAYDADFGFTLGGPIVKDKLWFFVGASPSLSRTDYTRTTKRETDCHITLPTGGLSDCEKQYGDGRADIDPKTGFFLTDTLDSEIRSATSHSYSMLGKLNLALDPENQAQLSLIAVPSSSESPALVGLPSTATKASGLTTDTAARWTSKLDDGHLELEALLAWHHSSLDGGSVDPAYDNQPRQDLIGGSLGTWSALGGESAKTTAGCTDGGANDPYPNIRNCPMTSLAYATGGPGGLLHEHEDRRTARLSAIERIGKHEIKAGIDGELAQKATTRGYSGGALIENNIDGQQIEVLRYVQLGAGDQTCQTPDPNNTTKKGATIAVPCTYVGARDVEGETLSWAAYLRDSWAAVQGLTLNYGVRYEEQRLRYAEYLQPTMGKNAMTLTGNWAPRLGVLWDPTQEGRSKLFVSWGRFYEAIPMDINDRSFGGEVSQTQTFAAKDCGAGNPGFGGVDGLGCLSTTNPATTENIVGAKGSVIDPSVKAEYLDELLIGGEYQVAADWKVGLTYQNRRLGRVLEDVSLDGANTYIITNPGEGVAKAFDKPVRDYDAVTATASHRFADALFVQASYTYSRTIGNYPGSASYSNGQIDPNISSQYDLIELLANRYGRLPQDRPHSLKVDAFYTFHWANNLITVGARGRAVSGTPENALGAHYLYGPNESFLLPRGAMGRTDLEHALDLHVAYGRKLSDTMTAELFADIFNVYDSQRAFAVDETYAPSYRSDGTPSYANPISGGQYRDLLFSKSVNADGSETSNPISRNPNFGNPISRYAPTSARLGFRLTF